MRGFRQEKTGRWGGGEGEGGGGQIITHDLK